MRELIFRGKTVDNGVWVEGFYVRLHDHKGNETHRIYTGYAETDCGDYYPDWFEVDPNTVGQYTGLKDKNGKRIFEGDIERWTGKKTYLTSNYSYFGNYGYGAMLVVTALESGFTLRHIKDNAPEIPNANTKIDNYSFWNHHNQLEVIGNTHDNPELLEGQ